LETLCDIFFEFSNEDRLRILHTLKETPLTVTSLSRELGLTTQSSRPSRTRRSTSGG